MRRVLVYLTFCSACATATGSAHAQGWVDQVFPERSFDFGTVAKGSKIRHSFKVVNHLDRDVNIADYRTLCGCTDVRIGSRLIPPGAQTVVEAVIDTTRFVGVKPSGLTLVIDSPERTEVALSTTCFIRGDITVTPGVVDFQVVERGSASKPTVSLNLDYSGGDTNWGIFQIKTKSSSVRATARIQPSRGDGLVHYVLSATLDPTDLNGFFKDELVLHTNDTSTPTIPLAVVANIRSAVTVTPTNLVLGPVKAGQTVEKTLLIRSSKPFKLTSVTPNKEDFTATPDPDETKSVHTVKVRFKAPAKTGAYNATFEILTDLNGEPAAKMTTFATIIP